MSELSLCVKQCIFQHVEINLQGFAYLNMKFRIIKVMEEIIIALFRKDFLYQSLENTYYIRKKKMD